MRPSAAVSAGVFAAAAFALWPACARAPESPEALLATAAACHGAPPAPGADAPPSAPGLSTGLGDAGFRVERAGPQAAAYFAQGVRLFHAFNAPEAIRALRWAEHEDPSCAMCFWAEAWARGPTINYPVDGAEAARARAAAERAGALSAGLSPQALGLIAAERSRHPLKNGAAVVDNPAYARAMTALAERFPADDAIAVEAASALLIASGQAWENIAAQGATPDVRRARALLETVLARSPDYTPAIHYDVHLMEWTGEPARAVAAADRLGALAPAAGHLVHMPSHLYYRLGRYQDAATANARAVVADGAFVREHGSPGGLPNFALHAHNVSFGLAAALMSGDGPGALAFGRSAEGVFGDASGVGPRSYLAWARYGDSEQVLKLARPGPPFAQALWRYARGEALARRGDPAGVQAEARAIAALDIGPRVGAPERAVVEIARLTLQGRAALLEHRPADAVAPFRKATDLREKVDLVPDPPLWPLPPRRSLAAALLLSGDVAGARAEAARSLTRDVGDPLALHVLAEAQKRAGSPEAAKTEAAAGRGWRGARELWRLELT